MIKPTDCELIINIIRDFEYNGTIVCVVPKYRDIYKLYIQPIVEYLIKCGIKKDNIIYRKSQIWVRDNENETYIKFISEDHVQKGRIKGYHDYYLINLCTYKDNVDLYVK
jgi:hypothetical protein